ncbi:hypothetical protein ACTQ2R_12990 [Hallella faecis]|uniref:hypothetical protein n=1 Tax=Hallella faecis TaxID=2841596 RepID=UPI003F8E0341
MNHLRRLKLTFWAPIAICGAMVACFESGALIEGGYIGDKQLEYYCALVMELVTIVLIPLALRLFRLKWVDKAIRKNPSKQLPVWRSIRLCLLAVPMMVNVFMYYQFVHPSFGYMAIIGLLTMAFIYPSAARCQAEENME